MGAVWQIPEEGAPCHCDPMTRAFEFLSNSGS